MKYLSKSTRIVMLLVSISAFLNPVALSIGVHYELPVMVILAAIISVFQVLYVIQVNNKVNELLTEINEHEPCIVTAQVQSFIHKNREHKLYMCKNRSHNFCKNCGHSTVHERTAECDIHDCEIVIAVYN